MADWNRTDYDALERAGRWRMTLLSSDALHGVSPVLIGYLAVALAVLAAVGR